MRECSRPTDVLCRMGGEEFLMLLPETDATGASVAAERLLTRLRQTTSRPERRLPPQSALPLAATTRTPMPPSRPRTPHSTRRNRPAETALWSPPRSDSGSPDGPDATLTLRVRSVHGAVHAICCLAAVSSHEDENISCLIIVVIDIECAPSLPSRSFRCGALSSRYLRFRPSPALSPPTPAAPLDAAGARGKCGSPHLPNAPTGQYKAIAPPARPARHGPTPPFMTRRNRSAWCRRRWYRTSARCARKMRSTTPAA